MRWLVSLLALFSVTVIADQAQIEKAITGINPMIQIKSVKPIDDTPFYEVTLKTGERIYTDSTGSYFVAGDLYQVDTGGVKNLTDVGRRWRCWSPCRPRFLVVSVVLVVVGVVDCMDATEGNMTSV